MLLSSTLLNRCRSHLIVLMKSKRKLGCSRQFQEIFLQTLHLVAPYNKIVWTLLREASYAFQDLLTLLATANRGSCHD